MNPPPVDTPRNWIDIAARAPWWAYVVLALATTALVGRLAFSVMTWARQRGFIVPIALLLVVLGIVFPVLILVAGAASIWGRMRQAALREVNVAAPSEAELAAAREAGRALAERGAPGLVLAGGGAKGAYQVGCWKALRACGVTRFGAIAGTSVGALNAVLVANDDFDKAESIWHDMSFGRVLRLRWHAALALLIRLVLIVPYLGKLVYPARAIPVPMWRAVRKYRDSQGDPVPQVVAALELYRAFLERPDSVDLVSQIVLAAVVLAGLSWWWMLASPILALLATLFVGPLLAVMVTTYASWFVIMLDQLSTRLVLASNEPLHQLVLECANVPRLRTSSRPIFVTLASLREVTRVVKPTGPKTDAAADGSPAISPRIFDFSAAPSPKKDWSCTTIDYVPSHFDLRSCDPGAVHELILQ